MAQRAADVARREAALAASEGPAADLAARLRAADERIFEQRAEMATIELDARYQVERAREAAASEGRFARDRLEREARDLRRRVARLESQRAAANRAAASPTPDNTPMEDVSTSEPRSSAADDALRVVFGERRDEVASLCVASPALRAACAGLAGSGDRAAAVEAALAALGAVAAKAASRQSSEDAVERARAALGVAADLCAACGGGAAAAAAAAPARAGSGRCVAIALDIASKAEHPLRRTAAATAATAAACALPPADAQTAAWWRARAAEALNAASPNDGAADALDLAAAVAHSQGDTEIEVDVWPAVAALAARCAEKSDGPALERVAALCGSAAGRDVRRGAARLSYQSDGRAVAAVLARAANDVDASSVLARGVVAALGHVAFFAPDLGFDVVLGARGDALAAHEVAALCERAVALGEGANDATAVLARVKNLTRPAPSPSQSQ